MEKLKFEGELIINTTFNGTNTNILFGTDWMTQLQLYDLPVNSYCQKNWTFGCRNWKTKKKKKKHNWRKPIQNFFFWWVRKVYQDDGKIWATKQRSASVQKEMKCALCLVGTNQRGTWLYFYQSLSTAKWPHQWSM